MAEKKDDCGCGCIPLKKDSEKPAKDKKKTKKSKQVEHCSVPPGGWECGEKFLSPLVYLRNFSNGGVKCVICGTSRNMQHCNDNEQFTESTFKYQNNPKIKDS